MHLDSDPDALEAALQAEFPEARLENEDAGLAQWRQQLADYVDGRTDWPLLPVDLRGTAFQLAVWSALREIPAGTTLTYAELAARIGKPRAVRAVASACAANRVALAVPCHRIVRGDVNLPLEGGPDTLRAVYGDATHADTLKQAGIEEADTLILSASGLHTSGEIVRTARELNPNLRVLARADYLREVDALREAGVQQAFSGEGEIALAMTTAILEHLGASPEQIDRERDRVHRELGVAGDGQDVAGATS